MLVELLLAGGAPNPMIATNISEWAFADEFAAAALGKECASNRYAPHESI